MNFRPSNIEDVNNWLGRSMYQGDAYFNGSIDEFRAFYRLSPLFDQGVEGNTNLVQQVPFSPSLKLSRYATWQANDPLVHYHLEDLRDNGVNRTEGERVQAKTVARNVSSYLGAMSYDNYVRLHNRRYKPWGVIRLADGSGDGLHAVDEGST